MNTETNTDIQNDNMNTVQNVVPNVVSNVVPDMAKLRKAISQQQNYSSRERLRQAIKEKQFKRLNQTMKERSVVDMVDELYYNTDAKKELDEIMNSKSKKKKQKSLGKLVNELSNSLNKVLGDVDELENVTNNNNRVIIEEN